MTDCRKYILSTGTHYISNSGSDENGLTVNGDLTVTGTVHN